MTPLVLTGVTQPWLIELRPGLNRLGRNPTNDFRIADASVSSFHCEIVVSDNLVLVRDLGSTNGTFINREPIQEATLHVGQTLHLGQAELRCESQLPQIAIPSVIPPQPTLQTYLPDGSPACWNHPGRQPNYKCTHCEHLFCSNCVRILGLAGGKSMIFCPSCNAQCERMTEEPVAEATTATAKKPSFLGRLTQTLKLPFQR